jgi:hypothetical protein
MPSAEGGAHRNHGGGQVWDLPTREGMSVGWGLVGREEDRTLKRDSTTFAVKDVREVLE